MTLTAEFTKSLASELQTIKWLLAALVFISLSISLFFFLVVKKINDQSSLLGRQLHNTRLQAELEELLAKGDTVTAKFRALEWAASQPAEPYAHWFLGKAYYQLGALIEAKKTLTHLLTISPDWHGAVIPWLDRIESEIQPRAVQ